jgi:CheY-like chemotaxis protein
LVYHTRCGIINRWYYYVMKKILVIDDDQFFNKALAAALPAEKYKVIEAQDGEQGLNQMREEKPDLVVLDLLMPKLDGTAFLKQVKADPLLSKVPVLVSSNLSSVKKISDVIAMGAVGYVIKSNESMQSIVQDIERIIGENNG